MGSSSQPATIAHHHSSPYATERRRYLSLLMEEGRSRNSLRVVAELLISYARHLPLDRAEICGSDIEVAAGAWAKTRHRSASCLRVGKREFVFHATKWLRLPGRLYEPRVEWASIRAWLGHVSIDTTNIYAEVDLQRKAEVLAHCNALRTTSSNKKRWRDDPSLMAFLRSL